MRKKNKNIPVHQLPPGAGKGVMIMHDSFDGCMQMNHVQNAHRDSGFTFILQEKGITHLEVDFQTCQLVAPAVIIIHPSQVHRVIGFEKATISTWMIAEENIRPEYADLLHKNSPFDVLPISAEHLEVLSEAASVCLKLFDKKDDYLHTAISNDSCNILVGLVISRYLSQAKPAVTHNRLEAVTKAFKHELEQSFSSVKSPSAYADRLNLSTSYLNDCVKATTGHPVSHHIKQRVVLEAKRLLYHSSRSVKEVAGMLGYDDYSYFTRIFVKIAGLTPIAFRDETRD